MYYCALLNIAPILNKWTWGRKQKLEAFEPLIYMLRSFSLSQNIRTPMTWLLLLLGTPALNPCLNDVCSAANRRNSTRGDNELTPSRGVSCQYLPDVVHLLGKLRWVHEGFAFKTLTRLIESTNATSEAHYTWSASTNIASKVTSEAQYT